MKKRTLKAGRFQRHYATNGILMYRERKNLIDVPEGALIEILKARRQTHLCSIRCVANEEGNLILGNGRKAEDTCIAVPAEYLPKMKIEGAAPAKGKGNKGTKKGNKPVVAAEATATTPEVGAGMGPADIQTNDEHGLTPAQVQAEEQMAEQPAAPAAAEAPVPEPAPATAETAAV